MAYLLALALLALCAERTAADYCAFESVPESCLNHTEGNSELMCAWLILGGRCVHHASDDAHSSPPGCCTSMAAEAMCEHQIADVPDGACSVPHETNLNTTAFSLSYATRMVHLAGAAYCSAQAVQSWSCGVHCDDVSGLEMVQYVNNEDLDLAAFVAWDSTLGAIVVSFRGTVQTISNWVNNLEFTKTKPFSQFPNAGVHHGFWDAYQGLKGGVMSAIENIQKAHATSTLVITGHSLGAAMATDCAMDLSLNGFKTSIVNFGDPRAGDKDFHDALRQQVPDLWRVTHANDIVPHVPPEALGFYHAANEVFFAGGDTDLSYVICDGSGEDPSCSNRCSPLSCTSVANHLSYLGFALGGDGCSSTATIV